MRNGVNDSTHMKPAQLVELREHLDGKRTWAARATISSTEQRDDGGLCIRGNAAVFDSDSEPLYGMFVEQIRRGAFRKVLRGSPDVRLLFNHDGQPMARTGNGSLRLKETPAGLEYEAELADTTLARDIHALIERGDLDQMSFAFTVAKDEWKRTCTCSDADCDCLRRRFINEVAELFEVSVVTFPAYRATTAEVLRTDESESQESRGGDDQQPTGSGDSTDVVERLRAAKAIALKARLHQINHTRGN